MEFLAHITAVQYCYAYLVDQIPVGLLLYSHVPTAIIALLFGGFLIFHTRNLPSTTLLIVCTAFAAWCFSDLVSWFAFLGSGLTMFTWSLEDFFALIFFFFSYYFLYTFLTERDLPSWQKGAGLILLLPTALWTLSGQTLVSYDANQCQANESSLITLYPYFVEGIFIVSLLVFAVYLYRKTSDHAKRVQIVLATTGVFIFLGFFFLSTLGVNVLVNLDSAYQFAYNFEIYGLFGMPILLIYLGYLIVRYKAFHLKVFGAQALIVALIAVIASEFAFVSSLTNRILVGITLILTATLGYILIRSVQREIQQREHIQILADNLEKSNKQQVVLIHFITHQIKGFVSKSRNIFSMLLEGDFGQLPAEMRPMVEEGFRSDTQGATTIQEILNASNVKNGAVTYKMEPFDFGALVQEIVTSLKPNAEAKNLTFTLTGDTDPYTIVGDRMQLQNAVKNIIDNSIKYTPSGSVAITLTKQDGVVRFTEHDTGVGISAEDMSHLFTEGGHGKESVKVNVESTGFGLYIVKNIIDAHHGKVWAESEGAGKGSTFTIELPVESSSA